MTVTVADDERGALLEGRRELGFPVEIRRREVLRLLGMGRSKRPLRPNLDRIVVDETAAGRELLDPRALAGVLPDGLAGSTFLAPGPVALVVCTIGPALGERVSNLSRRGEVTRAMILDAIGSASVEELADRINQDICERALAEGYAPGPRRSPGYGGWSLTEQELLFAELEPGEIGVSLSPVCLMSPTKSISYAIPLDEGAAVGSTLDRCRRCGLEVCSYREE